MNNNTTLKAIFTKKIFSLFLKMERWKWQYPGRVKEYFSGNLTCDSSCEIEFPCFQN